MLPPGNKRRRQAGPPCQCSRCRAERGDEFDPLLSHGVKCRNTINGAGAEVGPLKALWLKSEALPAPVVKVQPNCVKCGYDKFIRVVGLNEEVIRCLRCAADQPEPAPAPIETTHIEIKRVDGDAHGFQGSFRLPVSLESVMRGAMFGTSPLLAAYGPTKLMQQVQAAAVAAQELQARTDRTRREEIERVTRQLFGPRLPVVKMRDYKRLCSIEGRVMEQELGFYIRKKKDSRTWTQIYIKDGCAVHTKPMLKGKKSLTRAEFDRLKATGEAGLDANQKPIMFERELGGIKDHSGWISVTIIGEGFEAGVTGEIAKNEAASVGAHFIAAHCTQLHELDTRRAKLEAELAAIEETRSSVINDGAGELNAAKLAIADELISLFGLLPVWALETFDGEEVGVTRGLTLEQACQKRDNYGIQNNVFLSLPFAQIFDDNEDNA